MTARIAVASATAFVACILAANYVTTEYGMVPVGFGLTATAGTYFAGLTFVLRDAVQDFGGRPLVRRLITWGAILSLGIGLVLAVTSNSGWLGVRIAIASGIAFGASEWLDYRVYTPLRDHGYVRAAVASNVVGAFVDTVLFLWIAGFPIMGAVAGQMVGKVMVTLAVVLVVAVVRTRRAVTA